MRVLNKIPMAMCGLILGMEALGNLLIMLNFSFLGNILGVMGMALMFIVLTKLILAFPSAYKEVLNPLSSGTLPTFTMSLMLISMYWSRWGFPHFGLILWILAIVCHIAIMVTFCYVNLINNKFDLKDVYPSWFVMFVGIGVIPVSAKLFIIPVGQFFFFIALGLYIIVFPIVALRLFRHHVILEGALPLLTIIAAPASLCLTGYLNSFSQINNIFAILLGVFAQFLYFITILTMARIYILSEHSVLKFYPSFAAFTFPLVISATGLTVLLNHLKIKSYLINIAEVEQIIAVIVVIYVLVHYIKFLSVLIKHNFRKLLETNIERDSQD
ncbi:C4-dicarboxylate ABC transporter [Oenococcus sp. UCMA 14587]|nr:C4-dicarboxylate ABC transporter [Oenococcus sp. UCMA 14587]